ncbi:hypothetical protein TU94_28305 [Streptomyces cyaneogriseus subsp. noncyanogenus]|uniref:Uncharacterized protein n=1 Tax=Streptomyces cyaneogriseus subsp. noncyanogenus TaxID=477245 RepID=A0A0C5G445_9ACTN|nr:hypothetical protein [Streptomyces cyaneogriseus]AJP04768.1 hypothetical protein TU94_28305 [Streptomyces cyaneogriseus subsp. noncyanogenus]
MTDTLTRSLFAADTVTETALAETQRHTRFWVGHSGETIPGSEVADYLDALRELLETRGWVPSYRGDDSELPELDESLSLKAMLLSAWRHVREALGPDRGPITLTGARVQVDGGDADVVGGRVLDALVAGLTGVRTAHATAWVARKGRTWDEVRDLLAAAADFARTHGPR